MSEYLGLLSVNISLERYVSFSDRYRSRPDSLMGKSYSDFCEMDENLFFTRAIFFCCHGTASARAAPARKPPTGKCGAVIRRIALLLGLSFSQRATKQPISHRGSWGAQTDPGTFRRQLISIIMNYNQPWTTLGLAPQPQRENFDPNGSQGSANFHCIMVPGSPWSALRSLLRLQSAILTSTSDARDFVGGPKHR